MEPLDAHDLHSYIYSMEAMNEFILDLPRAYNEVQRIFFRKRSL
jgi:hypothetical protein